MAIKHTLLFRPVVPCALLWVGLAVFKYHHAAGAVIEW